MFPSLPTVRNTLDTKTEHQKLGMGMGIHISAGRYRSSRGPHTTRMTLDFWITVLSINQLELTILESRQTAFRNTDHSLASQTALMNKFWRREFRHSTLAIKLKRKRKVSSTETIDQSATGSRLPLVKHLHELWYHSLRLHYGTSHQRLTNYQNSLTHHT